MNFILLYFKRSKMAMRLGDTFPNLQVDTTDGPISLYDYFGERCSR